MVEVSLRGEKYTGVFDGDKHEVSGTKMVSTEVGIHPESYRHEWYDGAGIVQHLSNGRKYFFTFLVGEDHCKPSLEKTLNGLAGNFGGCDPFLESIRFKINKSKEQIPRIYLPE